MAVQRENFVALSPLTVGVISVCLLPKTMHFYPTWRKYMGSKTFPQQEKQGKGQELRSPSPLLGFWWVIALGLLVCLAHLEQWLTQKHRGWAHLRAGKCIPTPLEWIKMEVCFPILVHRNSDSESGHLGNAGWEERFLKLCVTERHFTAAGLKGLVVGPMFFLCLFAFHLFHFSLHREKVLTPSAAFLTISELPPSYQLAKEMKEVGLKN